ncbi:thiamine monophosphate kinase [Fictibacillus macauensis ZFHKF-1]|uniref:Thiamine-monophosphate kinase n=1 Tax=Fictibacillus macauensis ZFHKF-1 TaxID=1196324 RepID=I8AFI6_9BACL|nr:thiamine-phosphate kinase [Fictibacillus macauensis]EIT84397.1 thiamine monophosphate kinase [Fictibacillus macauensis ZFHKF-1]
MRDEFAWIASITPKEHRQASLLEGIGDDAALVKGSEEEDQVVCLDTMVEGVHFTTDTMAPFHIGHKALAANISDVAAMGGIPRYYLVSIAVPASWSEEALGEIYKGMDTLAETYKMDLIGGDTVSTKGPLVLSITVIGSVESGKKLLRRNARPGDVVFMTGCAGDAAGGLALLLEHTRNHPFTLTEQALVQAHQLPLPNVEAGRLLAEANVRVALNDISDGVASEATEIAESSGVKLTLVWDKLPKSIALQSYPQEQQEQWLLYGGEDYTLIGTMAQEDFSLIQQKAKDCNLSFIAVGKVEAGAPAVWLERSQQPIEALHKAGYNHFS